MKKVIKQMLRHIVITCGYGIALLILIYFADPVSVKQGPFIEIILALYPLGLVVRIVFLIMQWCANEILGAGKDAKELVETLKNKEGDDAKR